MITRSHTGVPAPADRLSERQRECLVLVHQGLTSKEIGRSLGLSPSTVDNHIRAALERLGVDNRAAAARLAVWQPDAVPLPRAVSGPSPGPGAGFAALAAFPPLGGSPNRLSVRRRVYHVVQIALFSTMSLAAITTTIAGLVHLLNR